MHDHVWPGSSNLNSSDYDSSGLSNVTKDKSSSSSNSSSLTSYGLGGHGSFDVSFDVFYDGSQLGPDGADTFPIEIGKQKRIRRRNRRRKNARTSASMMASQSLSKVDDEYNSDDYAETEASSTSSLINKPSNADFDDNPLTKPSHALSQLESGENVYSQTNYQLTPFAAQQQPTAKLKPVIVDGSNVALCHGNSDCYSYHGIQICLEWFKVRGHTDIKVVLPSWHVDSNNFLLYSYCGKEVLASSDLRKHLLHTNSSPSDRQFLCNYIINLAIKSNAIIVSNDRYGDITKNNSEVKKQVYERLLSYVFVDDKFMPPDTPLGRYGPTLDVYLQHNERSQFAQICPYKTRCTYGNKCRYYHPESSFYASSRSASNPASTGAGDFNSLPAYNKPSTKEYPSTKNALWPSTGSGKTSNLTGMSLLSRKPGLLNVDPSSSHHTFQPYPQTRGTPLHDYDHENSGAGGAFDFAEAKVDEQSCAEPIKPRSSPNKLAFNCVENLWKKDSVDCDIMSTISVGMDKEKSRYLLFCRLCSFYPYKMVKQAMDDLPSETDMHVLDKHVKSLLQQSKPFDTI